LFVSERIDGYDFVIAGLGHVVSLVIKQYALTVLYRNFYHGTSGSRALTVIDYFSNEKVLDSALATRIREKFLSLSLAGHPFSQ